MRAWFVLMLLAVSSPALAQAWVWRDEVGAEHWTDDPTTVPEAHRHSLRRLGEEEQADEDEGGWYSGISVDDTETDPRAILQAQIELQRRQALLRSIEALQVEVAALERERIGLDNEHRRYKVGGRIGAADRAVAARAKLDALDRELAEKRAALARAEAGLAVLE